MNRKNQTLYHYLKRVREVSQIEVFKILNGYEIFFREVSQIEVFKILNGYETNFITQER